MYGTLDAMGCTGLIQSGKFKWEKVFIYSGILGNLKKVREENVE